MVLIWLSDKSDLSWIIYILNWPGLVDSVPLFTAVDFEESEESEAEAATDDPQIRKYNNNFGTKRFLGLSGIREFFFAAIQNQTQLLIVTYFRTCPRHCACWEEPGECRRSFDRPQRLWRRLRRSRLQGTRQRVRIRLRLRPSSRGLRGLRWRTRYKRVPSEILLIEIWSLSYDLLWVSCNPLWRLITLSRYKY